ncbi:RepB family plasmid replication initiator protein [Persicobacter diffluens]|uniref:Initiator Rep protein WH1 domain-containing protein n=1 Tax=Persicobacter diffluens TaxID=981 RepID=A0AAN5AM77_9BACT|nr:hypothetical protein PEDI_53320 [Persicobacter diffluens]
MTEQNQIKVAQSNDLTNGRVDFIPLQIDIFYVMLSKVGENDPWTGKYRTSVQELKNLGGKSVNHTRIETAIRGNRSENLPALASTFWRFEEKTESGTISQYLVKLITILVESPFSLMRRFHLSYII